MNPPDLTFCLTAHSRPTGLRQTLLSLQAQREADFDIIVGNNATGWSEALGIENTCIQLGVKEYRNESVDCYTHSEYLATKATGEFICFPSEEDYYMPTFARNLLAIAKSGFDLVWCNCVYDYRHDGSYRILETRPTVGLIDKGGFIVRRSVFPGFPNKPESDVSAQCDGQLIEKLVKSGSAKFASLSEVLWVHN